VDEIGTSATTSHLQSPATAIASLTKELEDSMKIGGKKKGTSRHRQELDLAGATRGQFVVKPQVTHAHFIACHRTA